MAVLQKIRVKFGVLISVIIALALLSFIIDPGTLETALNSMSSKFDVGKIAGKSVSYTDYADDVERYTKLNQIITGSSVQNEQTQKQIRDAAWQELLDKYMFEKYAHKAGINVGQDELVALTSGDMVSPVIAQNPYFMDENGQFSTAKLVDFIQSIPDDESGNSRLYWNYLQNTIRTQQYYAKYGALFTQSNLSNPIVEKNLIDGNNNTFDVDYVVERYGFTRDTTIAVSNSEVMAYYKAHKDFYKQGASRDAEYVVFEVVPSQSDVMAASEEMDKAYAEFTTTDNMKAFLLRNSDRSLSSYWYKDGELASVSKEISEFVKGAKKGAVSPIYKDGNTFRAVKVMDISKLPDNVSVRVIPATDAEKITPELLAKLREAEPMNMTQSYLLPGLEKVFTSPVGKPELIKTTQYGTVLAEVVSKSELLSKKQVAILEKTALASKETFGTYYSQANRFSTIADGTLEGYKKAVDSLGVYSHRVNKVTEGTSNYGAIDQAREVTRWIFEAKEGKASQIITVNNDYFFVVALKAIHKEGFTPVAEVAPTIRENLYMDKLREKTCAEVASKIEGLGTLEEVAEALGSSVIPATGLSFTTAAGADPALIGAASKAEEGKLCGPVAGESGIFVFSVKNRETGSFFTEDDARNAAAQQAQYASRIVMSAMMDNAEVKDNRARFF